MPKFKEQMRINPLTAMWQFVIITHAVVCPTSSGMFLYVPISALLSAPV